MSKRNYQNNSYRSSKNDKRHPVLGVFKFIYRKSMLTITNEYYLLTALKGGDRFVTY